MAGRSRISSGGNSCVFSRSEYHRLLTFIFYFYLFQNVMVVDAQGKGKDLAIPKPQFSYAAAASPGPEVPQPIGVWTDAPPIVPTILPYPVLAPSPMLVPIIAPIPLPAPAPIPMPIPLPIPMPQPGPIPMPVQVPLAYPAPGPVAIPISAPMPVPIPLPGGPYPPAPVQPEKEITQGVISVIVMSAATGLVFMACCLTASVSLLIYLCEKSGTLGIEKDLEACNEEESSVSDDQEDSNSEDLESVETTVTTEKREAIWNAVTHKETFEVQNKPDKGPLTKIEQSADKSIRKTTSKSRKIGVEVKIGSSNTNSAGKRRKSPGIRRTTDAKDVKNLWERVREEVEKRKKDNSSTKAKLADHKTSDTKTIDAGKGQPGGEDDRKDEDKNCQGSHGGTFAGHHLTTKQDDTKSRPKPQDSKTNGAKTFGDGKGQLQDGQEGDKNRLLRDSHPGGDGQQTTEDRKASKENLRLDEKQRKTKEQLDKGDKTGNLKPTNSDGKTSTVSPLDADSETPGSDDKKASGTAGLDGKMGKKDATNGKLGGGWSSQKKIDQSKPGDKTDGHGKGQQMDDKLSKENIRQFKQRIPTVLGGSDSRKAKIDGKDAVDKITEEKMSADQEKLHKVGKITGSTGSVDSRKKLGQSSSMTGLDSKKDKENDGKLERGQKPEQDAGPHGKDGKFLQDKISNSKPGKSSIPSSSSGASKDKMDDKTSEDKMAVDRMQNQRHKDGKTTGSDVDARNKMSHSKPDVDDGKKKLDYKFSPGKLSKPRTASHSSPSSGPSMDKLGGKDSMDKNQQTKDGKTAGSKDEDTDGSREKIDQSKPHPSSLPVEGLSREKIGKTTPQDKKILAEKPRPPSIPYTPSAGPSKEKIGTKEQKMSAEKIGNLKPQPPPLPYGSPGSNKEKVDEKEGKLPREKMSSEKMTNSKPRPPSLPFAAPSPGKEKVDQKTSQDKIDRWKLQPPALPFTAPSPNPRKEKIGDKKTSDERMSVEKPRPPPLPYSTPSPGSADKKLEKPREKISPPRPPILPYTAPSTGSVERKGQTLEKNGQPCPPSLPYVAPNLGPGKVGKLTSQEMMSVDKPRPPPIPFEPPRPR